MSLNRSAIVILFFLFVSVLFFSGIDRVGLFEPDEGRYSDLASEMVTSGDWITPHMNYVKHFHKPPLSMWATALSIKTFGFSEGAARLPNTLYGLGGLALVFYLVSFLFGFRSGLFSALILSTCGLYFICARLVTTDISLTFWILLSLTAMCLMLFSEKSKPKYYYVLAFALGCGFMTKGPVVFIVPFSTLVVFSLMHRRWLPFHGIRHVLGAVALFFLIALPWYILVVMRNEGLLDYFLFHQIGDRVTGTSIHFKKLWYFIPIIFAGSAVWCGFLPAAIQYVVGQSTSNNQEKQKLWFVLLWLIVPFVIFSAFPSKLPLYMVPMIPSVAILVGVYWARWTELGAGVMRSWLFHLCCGIWALALLAAYGAGYFFVFVKPKYIKGIPEFFFILAVIYVTLCLVMLIYFWIRKKYARLFWLMLAFMGIVALTATRALPHVVTEQSKPIAQKILEVRKPGEKIILFKTKMQALPVYIGERIVEVGKDREVDFNTEEDLAGYYYPHYDSIFDFVNSDERVFIVSRVNDMNRLQNESPKPLYPLLVHNKWALFSNQSDEL